MTKGLRPRRDEAQASVLAAVIAFATMRVIAAGSSLSWVVMGTRASVEGVACVTVAAETLMHWGHGALLAVLWRLVD